MTPDKDLQTFSIPQLETIAQEELKKLQDLIIPVDIETIVEERHKIEIDVKRGLKEHHYIWGMVGRDLDSGDIVILVDDQLLDFDHLYKIYRMTIAEEFAHILLHRDAIERVESLEDFKSLQNHPNWHEHDRNAKWLAAALLIPAWHVLDDGRKFYSQIVSAAGFSDPNAVKKYVRNLLADKYDVSVSAMDYRLQNWPVNIVEKIERSIHDRLGFLE